MNVVRIEEGFGTTWMQVEGVANCDCTQGKSGNDESNA
jgi:hypothetical protein